MMRSPVPELKRLIPLLLATLLGSELGAGLPLLTEDAATLGKDRWQLESAFTLSQAEADEAPGVHDYDLEFTLGAGLAETLDLSLALPLALGSDNGLAAKTGDVGLALKLGLGRLGPLDLALKPSLACLAGEEGYGRSGLQTDLSLAVSLAWGEHQLCFNLGWAQRDQALPAERPGQGRCSLAAQAQLAGNISLAAEGGLVQALDKGQDRADAWTSLGLAADLGAGRQACLAWRARNEGEILESAVLLGLTLNH